MPGGRFRQRNKLFVVSQESQEKAAGGQCWQPAQARGDRAVTGRKQHLLLCWAFIPKVFIYLFFIFLCRNLRRFQCIITHKKYFTCYFFLGLMVETTLNMLITESILNWDQSVPVKRPWPFNPSSARGACSWPSPTVRPPCRELWVKACLSLCCGRGQRRQTGHLVQDVQDSGPIYQLYKT